MGYPIADIEGIGAIYAAKLKTIGILKTHHLLDRGLTRQGRRQIADTAGASETQILKWTNMADLMRVRGVGEEYSELLDAAGVGTVKSLRTRKPRSLCQAMAAANRQKRLVRQLPGPNQVAKWVAHAKTLKPITTH